LATLPLAAGAAPLLPDLLVLESALGRARRTTDESRAPFSGSFDEATRLRCADGVSAIAIDAAALDQLAMLEQWLFERSLVPQAALAADLLPPRILPRSGRARALAVVPMASSPSLVEIDEPLRQLLIAVGAQPRPLARVIDDAAARGWPRDEARTQIAELVEQEIIYASAAPS
jgi:hypothetical protein